MKNWVLYLLFLFSWNLSTATTDEIFFRTISPPGGLSSESINKIVQDAYGYIWIGTNHGLLKYDSKQFERFYYDPKNKKGLPHGLITDLVVDKENILWVATRNGLCRFNRSTQSFLPFKYKTGDENTGIGNIYHIDCDLKGNLWIIDCIGFGILNTTSHKIHRLKPEKEEIPSAIHCDFLGNVWMGTRTGSVYRIDPKTLSMKRVIKGKGGLITTIYTDSTKLWVGSFSKGLTSFTTEGRLLNKYNFNEAIGRPLKNWAIRKIVKDKSNCLWIATYHGLFYQKKDQKLRWFDTNKNTGIPHSSIYDIFEDRQKGIWVGTWAGGLSYFHKAHNHFFNFSHTNNPFSLSNNLVSSFAQDKEGNIFIGAEKGGINLFDKKRGRFSAVPLSKKKNTFNIKCQCFDKNGGHWIGTKENGLWYRSVGEKQFRQFTKGPEDGHHISYNEVYSLFPVDSGVWIGTHGGGANFYHHRTERVSFYSSLFPNGPALKNSYIKSILVDSHSNLWLGTVNCFQRISLNKKKDQRTNNIPRTNIQYKYTYSITEIDNKSIWIGTRSAGIYIYDPLTGKFTTFDAKGLLKNKVIYGILEDSKGQIWITSNDGLILHNPSSGSSRRFVTTDGIQGLWFNPQSVFRDAEDHLYFGGTNGFSMFSPGNIKFNATPPEVVIKKIKINNQKELYPYCSTSDSILKEIQLNPNETTLRFEFTSNNFLLPEKNRFKYRLVNYYDDWIETDKDATALFANLKWGSYIFEVKSSNNDGVWSLEPARVSIIISKPIYATNLAIYIYLLLLSLSLYYVSRILKTRAKLENEIFVEKVHRKQEEQLNEMKLKFFTNISHEFRTPLALISGPIKALGQQGENLTDTQKDMVGIIQRNSSRLLTLINQVIDFRKIGKGKERLNISTLDIVEFIKDRAANFSFDARERSIHLVQEFPDAPIMMDFDAEKMDYIIFNLLSNAFKYTLPGGTITILVSDNKLPETASYSNQLCFGKPSTDNVISIRVTDTGSGIDSYDLPKIFDRFKEGKVHHKDSSGIGLSMCREYTLLHQGLIKVQSTSGQGSSFTVELPLKQNGERIFSESHRTVKNITIPKEKSESYRFEKKNTKVNETVLVVEDNLDLRKYITTILSPSFLVITATNGKEGLQIVKTTAIDSIVSDVMMPQMDGFEFCTEVKSDMATCHIPVILLTALSSTENKITGMRQGADAYIAKPFEDDLLIVQITTLLKQRKQLREHFSKNSFSNQSIEFEGLDNYFLKKLNEIIENNINDEELNIERLTELIGLSRSQLHRKLKSLTQYSTTEYIRVYRLEKAVKLLQTGRYNIDEIAFKVGFNTHSYFSRSFKKHYNQSPKEYLKSVKEKKGKSFKGSK